MDGPPDSRKLEGVSVYRKRLRSALASPFSVEEIVRIAMQYSVWALIGIVSVPATLAAQETRPQPTSRTIEMAKQPETPSTAGIRLAIPPEEAKTLVGHCDQFLFTKPQRLSYTNAQNLLLGKCAGLVRDALVVAEKRESSTELNASLIELRVSFKTYKKWICERKPEAPPKPKPAAKPVPDPEFGCADPGDTSKDALAGFYYARGMLDQIEQIIPVVMKKHGLFAQFAGVLVTGFSFADASQPEKPAAPTTTPPATTPPATTPPAATTTDATTDAKKEQVAVGNVVWQTRHFGDESLNPIDIHFGGRIGITPVLNLVAPAEPPEDDDNPTAGVTAVHQPAFAWTFAVQANRQLRGINAELGGFVKTGSTTLMSVPKVVDKGNASFVAFPLDKGSEQTSWLWEGGVEFNMFDTRLEQVHAEKGTATPQFQLLLALRKDERFRGGVYNAYENPTGRLVFRLTVDALQVFDRRAFGEAPKPFTFGFVVEHERSLAGKGIRVPPATRFIVRGNLDLLKGMTESPSAKKPATLPDPPTAPVTGEKPPPKAP
jgi:hypothetical protein